MIEVELKEDRGKWHTLELSTDLQVKGVAVTADHVALWSSKTLVVYQLSTEGLGDDARITSKTVGKCHLLVCASISMKLIATYVDKNFLNLSGIQVKLCLHELTTGPYHEPHEHSPCSDRPAQTSMQCLMSRGHVV
jgi:hypothetical protein